jgi:hypothetical protein
MTNFAEIDMNELSANLSLAQDVAIDTVAADPKKPSIRSIILSGLRDKKSTNEIAAEVKLHHPDSAAAAKSSKHIAYYRCLEKKGGKK